MSIQPATLAQEPVWGENESLVLRTFLLTPTGQQFLRRITWLRPRVTERKPFLRQIQQDERTGHEKCYDDILFMATPSQQSRANEQAAVNMTHESIVGHQ